MLAELPSCVSDLVRYVVESRRGPGVTPIQAKKACPKNPDAEPYARILYGIATWTSDHILDSAGARRAALKASMGLPMDLADLSDLQYGCPSLAKVLCREALHQASPGSPIGVGQFPEVMRHLLWHLLKVSMLAINPEAAPAALNAIVASWQSYDEASAILESLEACLDLSFDFEPGSLEAYKANNLALGDSPIWKECLTAVPRFFPDEDARGRTTLDKVKCDGHVSARSSRKKKGAKHRTNWSKGLLVIACPHRVIYGTMVLLDHESPRDVATFLYTRVPRSQLPRIFVYDNACKLFEWVARREVMAHHFKDTKFTTDFFHYGGVHDTIHNCSDSFRPSTESFGGLLFGANTSGVESINSFLRRLEHSIRNMSLRRFVRHVTCMADLWNEALCRGC